MPVLSSHADVKIDTEQIEKVLTDEVIKREVLEGAKADEAARKVAKAVGKLLKKTSVKEGPAKTDGVATESSAGLSRPEVQGARQP